MTGQPSKVSRVNRSNKKAPAVSSRGFHKTREQKIGSFTKS